MQTIDLLHHLPAADRERIHDAAKDEWMHVHYSSSTTRKGEDILHTPLDIVDQGKGVPRRTGTGREAHTITQFVADQRLRVVKKDRDEQLVTVDSRRHRAVVLVNDLKDHEVFHKMHPSVVVALSGKTAAFGGSVLVEEPLTPGMHNEPPGFLGQHLRAGEHGAWPDMETSRKLLIGQDTHHGGIGNQHLRLPGIETLDDGIFRLAR